MYKRSLEAGFHYIDHPFGYKHVKDQVAIILKHMHVYLKKKMESGERVTFKLHRATLKSVENNVASRNKIEQSIRMTKTCSLQKVCTWCWTRWRNTNCQVFGLCFCLLCNLLVNTSFFVVVLFIMQ